MTDLKILISYIFLIAAGSSFTFLSKVSTETKPLSYKLPESQLRLDTYVKFVSMPFRSMDMIHYSYELNILNNYNIDFEIRLIEVFDVRNPDTPIAQFDTAYLSEHLDFPGAGTDELKGNGFGVAGLWLQIPETSSPPKEIFHRIHVWHTKADGSIIDRTLDAAITELLELTTLSLALPFRPGKWMYTAFHHRDTRMVFEGSAKYPQRYAIDWIKVDDNNRYAIGDPSNNQNWPAYGEELLAVADGKVVDIRDGYEENTPGADEYAIDITRNSIAGNSIVIDIGNEVRAVYAHLIPNSARVKIGDHVKKGQVIGLLGNSGNSDCPHLHFHLELDSRTYLGGEGIPFHFEEYIQLANYSDPELADIWDHSKGELPLYNKMPEKRTNELPIGNGLVEFY